MAQRAREAAVFETPDPDRKLELVADAVAERVVDIVSGWFGRAMRVLEHSSLDLAVARGAAYYGLTRRGLGRRIGGGTAHAFYVGLDKNRALCVIPRGHDEGETVELSARTFQLTLGWPVPLALRCWGTSSFSTALWAAI